MKSKILFIALLIMFPSMFFSSCSWEPAVILYPLPQMDICLEPDNSTGFKSFDFVVPQTNIQQAVDAGGGEWYINSALLQDIKLLSADGTSTLNEIDSMEIFVRAANLLNDGLRIASNQSTQENEIGFKFEDFDLNQPIYDGDLHLRIRVLNTIGGNQAACYKLVGGIINIEAKAKRK